MQHTDNVYNGGNNHSFADPKFAYSVKIVWYTVGVMYLTNGYYYDATIVCMMFSHPLNSGWKER
jgi:spermidine/putrescine-binding protein